MYDHLQACGHCPHHNDSFLEVWCTKFSNLSWVNRIGGCGMFPYRDLPAQSGLSYLDGKILGRGRIGQQKQKHNDKSYHSKNNSKSKYRSVD
jgi:hypothetical protein